MFTKGDEHGETLSTNSIENTDAYYNMVLKHNTITTNIKENWRKNIEKKIYKFEVHSTSILYI